MKFSKSIPIQKISDLLNNKFTGNPYVKADGINEINRCEKGDIIFVGNKKYLKKALNSPASVIITDDSSIKLPKDKAAIISTNPFQDFNNLIKLELDNRNKSEKLICGSNTFIHPTVVTGKNVKIGDNCKIAANVVFYDNVTIGNQTIINANTVIGSPAFYYQKENSKYIPMQTCGEVLIGSNVDIGSGCTIDSGVTHKTIIGNGTKIDNQVHIGHDTIIGENCLFAAQVGIAGCNTIEDNVILWGQVGVPSNIKIGKGAVLLGQSAPMKDVSANQILLGSPADLSTKKFREISALRQLPDLLKKIKFLRWIS